MPPKPSWKPSRKKATSARPASCVAGAAQGHTGRSEGAVSNDVGIAPRPRGSDGRRRHAGTTGGRMQHGKKYRAAAELAAKAGQVQNLAEAVKLVKQTARAKFDETIVVSSHLGVDPRHSDQLVRGTVVLPHGTGKSLRVLVLARGEKEKEALAEGADFAGADEYVKKIQDGWLEVDAIVATPDMM